MRYSIPDLVKPYCTYYENYILKMLYYHRCLSRTSERSVRRRYELESDVLEGRRVHDSVPKTIRNVTAFLLLLLFFFLNFK